jgi:hypothetical protein
MKLMLTGLAVLALALSALADVVHLKTGTSIEGQVTRTDDGVVVKLPAGEMRISNDAIERIEKKTSAIEQYQKRAAAVQEDDPEAHYKLGLWAQSVGLKHQAREEFRKAVALKPGHAQAHQALGHRLVAGRWLTEDEGMHARGLVKFRGQWMTPEASARLQALEAELEVAREKRRAAEAELEKARDEIEAQRDAVLPVTVPNPYDAYYSSRYLRVPGSSYYYYWHTTPRYYVPYHTSPFGDWWRYPGGIRRTSPRRRHR